MTQTTHNNLFKAGGKPALIGSLPAEDHKEALSWIFDSTPELPLWPQLPAFPLERMLIQFNEGIPAIVEEDERTYFDISTGSFEQDQLKFYEEYLQAMEDPNTLTNSRFAVSRERAAGLYALPDAVKGKNNVTGLKGQVTGPFTLLTGIHDQNDRLGYYDATVRDMVVKGIAMKSAWQVRFLKKQSGLPAIVFIDEPALAGLGSSSFISISLDDIRQDLTEVINAIHQEGGLAGVHVCANTDWNLLLTSDVDIISFDAYGFFDRFITCKDLILSFLDRGGIIAWGIVPTSEEEHILKETAESLTSLWEKQAELLSGERYDMAAILNQTLITPSCGTGSLTPDLARRVLSLTRDVSAALREKY